MSKWEAETTMRFVQAYRSHECLWNFRSSAYKSRRRREAALGQIAAGMALPGFGVADARNKIKNLRSTYCQERKKVEVSRGSSDGLPYRPNLKWYDEFDAIWRDGADRRRAVVATEGGGSDDVAEQSDPCSEAEEEEEEPPSSLDSSRASTSGATAQAARGARKRTYRSEEVLDLISHSLAQTQAAGGQALVERHVAYGGHVAEELQALSPRMAVFCKKVINDAIFQAHLGNLTEHSRIVNGAGAVGEESRPTNDS